jgi:hypothetical protein
MSTPARVAEARLALGRRLAILRHDTGFTQACAAVRRGRAREAGRSARRVDGAASTDACPGSPGMVFGVMFTPGG